MEYEQLKLLSINDLQLLILEAKAALKHKLDNKKSKKALRGDNFYKISRHEIIQNKNKEIVIRNSSKPLIPVGHGSQKKIYSTIIYLKSFLLQDWSEIYPRFDKSQEKIFYVYAHIDLTKTGFSGTNEIGGEWKGMPFYIGKGCGERAYDLKRNQGHGKIIKKLKDLGFDKQNIVKIVFDNLTENEAYEIESKFIYFFGTIYNNNQGCLYNLDNPPVPKFVGVMEKLKLENLPSNKQIKEGLTCSVDI